MNSVLKTRLLHIEHFVPQCTTSDNRLYYVTTFSLFFVFRESLAPFWIEWLLLIWISGLLLGELISPQDKSGLGMIKIVVIVLNLVSHHSLESSPPFFKLMTKEKQSGGTFKVGRIFTR